MKIAAKMKVQFNERQTKAINAMAETLSTNTLGLLRIAFALLQTAIKEHKNGNSIGIIRDGVVKEIVNFK